MVLGAELLVDWIKHAFISKFNRINASVYVKFVSILCRDVTGCRRDNATLDHTHHVSRRLGLVSLPLAAVVTRMMIKFVNISSIRYDTIYGGLFIVLVFLSLVAFKILTSMVLMIHGVKSGHLHNNTLGSDSPVKCSRNLDEFANIERYKLFKGRIV